MNPEYIHDALDHLDDDLIQEADTVRRRAPCRPWKRWAALAACLCVAVAAAALWSPGLGSGTQQWSPDFDPEDYFAANSSLQSQLGAYIQRHRPALATSEDSLAESAIPYAEERDFSDARANWEAGGVLPDTEDYPLFHCTAHYLEDGSLYSVDFTWQRYDDPETAEEGYSLLTLTAAPQPVVRPQDTIGTELDEEGNEIPPTQTITVRDGIQIFGQGGSRQEKVLTYETDQGWYQITASWNDSPEDAAALLDWFWDHPVDLSQFPMEKGHTFSYLHDLTGWEDVFPSCRPDFAAFGYHTVSEVLTLKDDTPYSFEGIYAAHVSPADAQASTYQSTPGWAELQLYLTSDPTAYERQGAIGDLADLTEADFLAALQGDSTAAFFCHGLYCSLHLGGSATGQEAWAILSAL